MMMNKHTRERPLALIVDDDPTLRLTMGAALKKSGLDILNAETGGRASACSNPTSRISSFWM